MRKILIVFSVISFVAFLFVVALFFFPDNNPFKAQTVHFGLLGAFGVFTLMFGLTGGAEKVLFKKGGEFEFKGLVEETKITLVEVRKLAEFLGSLAFENIQRAMRFGGFKEREKKVFFDQAIDLMRRLKVQEDRIAALANKSWHMWVKKDYVFLILGNQVPSGFDNERIQKWKQIKENLVEDKLISPADLRKQLSDWNKLESLREDLITDYEYYLKHHEHRDFDRWCRMREEHPPLK